MFDPKDLHLILAAAQHVKDDDKLEPGNVSELLDRPDSEGHLPGLRFRLQEVPVCGRCFSVYKVIHEVVALIRSQKKDLWARKQQKRLAADAAASKERETAESIQRVLERRRQAVEEDARHQPYTDYCHAYNAQLRGFGDGCVQGAEWCIRKHLRMPDDVFESVETPAPKKAERPLQRAQSYALDDDFASWLHSREFERAASCVLDSAGDSPAGRLSLLARCSLKPTNTELTNSWPAPRLSHAGARGRSPHRATVGSGFTTPMKQGHQRYADSGGRSVNRSVSDRFGRRDIRTASGQSR
jgi:hypothetical protein